jgi:hypothetical protein
MQNKSNNNKKIGIYNSDIQGKEYNMNNIHLIYFILDIIFIRRSARQYA